jgi:Uma2 family endonuclease
MNMSTVPRVKQEAPPTVYPPLYRLSVEQYHRMARTGILPEDNTVEMLEGLLVTKMTKGPPHETCLGILNRRLVRALPDDKLLRIQSPITLSDSEPEPDLVIAEGDERRYADTHPRPRDVHLVCEVADSSLSLDRNDKLRLYARARIAIYWIVNLQDNRIEVYTQPRAGRTPTYQRRQDYGPEQEIPILIGGRELIRFRVSELLP